jgi:hypothetical protein
MLVRWFLMSLACVALLALGPAQSQSSTDGFMMLSPDDVQWKGPLGPIGVVSATVYGGPSKPGLYVQRVRNGQSQDISGMSALPRRIGICYIKLCGAVVQSSEIGNRKFFEEARHFFNPNTFAVIKKNIAHR